MSREDYDWTDIRLRRYPGLDDKPFTKETLKEAGFEFTEEDGSPITDDFSFSNDCCCTLCLGER
jgi:hypothetical protein